MPFVGGVLAGATASALATRWLEGRRTINRHVDDYRAHWGQRPEAAEGQLRYVALGDSAAQGVGATAVTRGYVPRIAERLRTASGRDVRVTNLSVSGATSDDVVRDQLPQFAELGFVPDLVTLDIGGNDVIYPGHNAATFERSLDQILAALPAGSFVADVPWFMVPVLAGQSQRMSVLAAALPELPYACGLATATLLTGDLVERPLHAAGGMLPVLRHEPDPALLERHAASAELSARWEERLAACVAAL